MLYYIPPAVARCLTMGPGEQARTSNHRPEHPRWRANDSFSLCNNCLGMCSQIQSRRTRPQLSSWSQHHGLPSTLSDSSILSHYHLHSTGIRVLRYHLGMRSGTTIPPISLRQVPCFSALLSAVIGNLNDKKITRETTIEMNPPFVTLFLSSAQSQSII